MRAESPAHLGGTGAARIAMASGTGNGPSKVRYARCPPRGISRPTVLRASPAPQPGLDRDRIRARRSTLTTCALHPGPLASQRHAARPGRHDPAGGGCIGTPWAASRARIRAVASASVLMTPRGRPVATVQASLRAPHPDVYGARRGRDDRSPGRPRQGARDGGGRASWRRLRRTSRTSVEVAAPSPRIHAHPSIDRT